MKCPRIKQSHFTRYLWKQKQCDDETTLMYRILQIVFNKLSVQTVVFM